MAFLNSLSISGSGLTASRFRMDVISENITNVSTTRTEKGGPYTRKMVVYQAMDSGSSFSKILDSKMNKKTQKGVKITGVIEDDKPYTPVYNPSHPDANPQGYVLMPNVDIVEETLDMMAASRAYDANLTAFNAIKAMASRALEIGR